MTDSSATLAQMRGEVGDSLPQSHIDYLAADGALFESYLAWRSSILETGALSKKHKLLMVVSLLTANRDEGPLGLYAGQARAEGASAEELKEALRVGILFSGGPGIHTASHVAHLLQD